MAALTRQEISDRAGAEPAFVDRLVELGLLVPDDTARFGDSDVARTRLIDMITHAGVSLDGLAAIVASGGLSFEFIEAATEQRFAPFGEESFSMASQRTGLPVELLLAIREAGGAATPAPEDHLSDEEAHVVRLLVYQAAIGVSHHSAERSLRVIGESLRRVAETESAWWRNDLVLPKLAAGQGWADIAAMSGEVSPELSRLSNDALLAMYHAQQAQSWMRNILEGVESMLEGAGLGARPERAPPAICFLDITGYTRLTEELGDAAALDLAGRLARIVQRTSSRLRGKPVKWLGDGVMFHFPEAAGAVEAAVDMVDAVHAAGLPPAHVGLHAGPVLFQDGDYFGRTVNIASRIADYARPGEVVVSEAVVALSATSRVRFSLIGDVELKGISEPLRLHAARPGD
jgi:adenylate cyclase